MEASLLAAQAVTPAKRPFEVVSAFGSASTPCDSPKPKYSEKTQSRASPLPMESFDNQSPPVIENDRSSRLSPALSTNSSLTSISSTPQLPFGFDGAAESSERNSTGQPTGSSGQQPPAKRRKLTPAEKEQRRAEKEQKEREKAEQKAKREEEKLAKDEERRQKNEVKEQKKREKELERQRIEDEKRRAEEEKDKKDRAQKRISNFFVKPKDPPKAPAEPEDTLSNIREGSLGSGEVPGILPLIKSDYHRTFLPFALPSHTTWAPASKFSWDEAAVKHMQDTLDHIGRDTEIYSLPNVTLAQVLNPNSIQRAPRGVRYEPVKDIIKRLTGSASNPVDLTGGEAIDPLRALQNIPVRYIHFDEDVRPPYIGTYTKLDQVMVSRTGRNPFQKRRPDTNYEYDSEAEWEEPEEGEDLRSEGDSELESNDGAEDMDDFLDDEDTDGQASKRRVLSGDLEPVCTGLCWEDTDGIPLDLSGMNIETSRTKLALLQDFLRLPIDPFSTAYWQDTESDSKRTTKPPDNTMHPPREPLQARPNIFINGTTPLLSSGIKSDPPVKKSANHSLRLLAGSELEEFKQAVVGSDHTKIGILALLKKQFPKVPNAVLSDTLNTYAERQGRNEAARWKLKEV